MAHGGKRTGAGRKPGDAWTGAKPRSDTQRQLARECVREVLTTATDPLAVLAEIAANPQADAQLRVQAATAACPYLYPRLSAQMVAHTTTVPEHESAQIVDRLMGRLARLVPATIEHAPTTENAPDAVAA